MGGLAPDGTLTDAVSRDGTKSQTAMRQNFTTTEITIATIASVGNSFHIL